MAIFLSKQWQILVMFNIFPGIVMLAKEYWHPRENIIYHKKTFDLSLLKILRQTFSTVFP